jgi:hypothetical protein
MKTKKIILFGALVIVLSTAFAFTNNTTSPKQTSIEKSKASSNNSGGFVLEDADQWK